jgi:hypothetical protein
MSWDKKSNFGPYYYRSQRVGSRVRKIYVGRGPEAEATAKKDEQRRAQRASEQASRKEAEAALREVEQALDDLEGFTNALVEATLTSNGYHFHRGSWRKRRHGKDSPAAEGR